MFAKHALRLAHLGAIDKIADRRATHVPTERPKAGSPSFTWERSANDARKLKRFDHDGQVRRGRQVLGHGSVQALRGDGAAERLVERKAVVLSGVGPAKVAPEATRSLGRPRLPLTLITDNIGQHKGQYGVGPICATLTSNQVFIAHGAEGLRVLAA